MENTKELAGRSGKKFGGVGKYQQLDGFCRGAKMHIKSRTHRLPYGDELASFDAILEYGTKASLAKVTNEDGYIYLGIGGGLLDEHRPGISKNECCYSLTIKLLSQHSKKIKKDEALLANGLAYINRNDCDGGGKNTNGLAEKMKIMMMMWPSDEEVEKTIRWFYAGWDIKKLDSENPDFTVDRVMKLTEEFEVKGVNFSDWQERAKQAEIAWEQAEFNKATKEVANQMSKRKLKVSVVNLKDGRIVPIVGISSTVMRVVPAILNKLNAGVVVQRNPSTGHIYISVNKGVIRKSFGFVYDLIKVLRLKEQYARGRVFTWNWKVLSSPFTIDAVPYWHLDPKSGNIFNGSLIRLDIEPTALSLDEIFWAVKVCFDWELFPPKYEHECQKETGLHCQGCMLRKFGLQKCMNSIEASKVKKNAINGRKLTAKKQIGVMT